MDRADFSFELPEELIAQQPLLQRSDSRLLVLNRHTGDLADRSFRDLADYVRAGDLLVFNDTRVIRARLFGRKATGGRVELLVERVLGPSTALASIRASRAPRQGSRLLFPGGVIFTVEGRRQDLFEVSCSEDLLPYLERCGTVPLPPYIKRPADELDSDRYQTVYSRAPGAVAAPTAGLHFDSSLLERLAALGAQSAFVTLHVGAGTFAPVRTQEVEDHVLHREWLRVGEDVCRAVAETRARAGRVFAVGTTTVRALETAAASGQVSPFEGDTRLFIYPGYEFRVIDGIITNFHLPESSLLMLVSAFAGTQPVLAAYRHAVAERYRFFSYGDAMLISPGGDL